jgi:translation initiation factor IF-1
VGKQDALEFAGVIVEALPNQTFKVKLENDHIVVCYTGGKMRKHKIRLVAGDKVTIEMTPYDLNKGRIMFRL